jgi:hypothetical protein
MGSPTARKSSVDDRHSIKGQEAKPDQNSASKGPVTLEMPQQGFGYPPTPGPRCAMEAGLSYLHDDTGAQCDVVESTRRYVSDQYL